MYDFFNKLKASALVTVSGAFPEGFLNGCAAAGVELMSVQALDEYTLRLRVPYRQLPALRTLADKNQCMVQEQEAAGAVRAARRLRRRLALVLGLVLFLMVLLWSKVYIWEIRVSGNETVPTGKILAALEECGVGIGSFWPNFTSDNIRSQALEKLPELSWLTVNIYGSRAEVLVRERVAKPEMLDNGSPADILAEKEGFVMEVRALVGEEQVRRGQAVAKGQLLVSGALGELSGDVRTVHAYGTVTARTYYEISAAAPVFQEQKTYTGVESSRWSLCVGSSRINFYRNSSIYEENCDKIYSVYKLEIKGLFSLPVCLVKETCRFYETGEQETDAYLTRLRLEERLHERLLEETDGGSILSEAYSCSQSGGLLTVCLRAECEEDIGVTVPMDGARLREIQESKSGEGTS